MEARQKAHEFIKEYGFKNQQNLIATKLAILLKNYVSEVVEKYENETGNMDIIDWRRWWAINNVRL